MPGPHASKHTTSSELVKTGPGVLHEAHLAAGADAAAATVYANTAGSGTVICRLAAPANGSDRFAPKDGVAFSVGLYVNLDSGTSPTVDTAYD